MPPPNIVHEKGSLPVFAKDIFDKLNHLNWNHGKGAIRQVVFTEWPTAYDKYEGYVVRHHGGGMADTVAKFTIVNGVLRFLGRRRTL